MITIPIAVDVPLSTDEHGAISIRGTRITLESINADYHCGNKPEEIVNHFPVLKLPMLTIFSDTTGFDVARGK